MKSKKQFLFTDKNSGMEAALAQKLGGLGASAYLDTTVEAKMSSALRKAWPAFYTQMVTQQDIRFSTIVSLDKSHRSKIA